MGQNYYYKDGNGGYYNFKSKNPDLIEITEEEFNEANNRFLPDKATIEKLNLIEIKQERLNIVKWKIEQVVLFGETRDDLEQLKEEAVQLHHELEELKKN